MSANFEQLHLSIRKGRKPHHRKRGRWPIVLFVLPGIAGLQALAHTIKYRFHF